METRFIEIFTLWKNDVYRLAYSYTKNIQDTEDIVQNVFIKLYKHPLILNKDNIEVKKWLLKVTVNECKNLIISSWKKKIIPLTEKEVNKEIITFDEDSIMPELLKLPRKYRLVIYLYYYELYKLKEIAQILNISETNARTILARAREKLKIILEGEKL